MNGITILIWITILIIGAIAVIGVKLHYRGNELEKDDTSILPTETINGILSDRQDKVTDENEISTISYSQHDSDYEIVDSYDIKESNYQNIEYESQNQVLINYENKVKKFQEPMNENQIDIMTPNNDQNNEKHELKDLFTIDELIKESKRKDSEREKESQKIQKEKEDTTEIKESIRKRQENDDIEEKLIEEILADEEIGELLKGEDESQETIEDVIENEEKPVEETIQEVVSAEEEPVEETIQDIIDKADKKEETIEEETSTAQPEETIQDVLDVEETPVETDATIEETTESEPEIEVPQTTTQKDIAEAIDNASQEIEEEKIESISETAGITDALLNTEEEIKQPTLKSPTKIKDSNISSPTDDSNMAEEENDLDYRKDLAKITNTIKGSKLFQDVKERLRPEPDEEIDPIADLEESYIRNVNEFDDYEDEYAPIINETHDEFGEYYEPDYDEAIRQENTRKLFGNTQKAPEPEIAEPKKEVIKSKPSRNNIKINLNNVEVVLKKGDEIIFNHDGETYSSQVYAINGDDISVRYRRKDIVIKPEDVKKIY